VFPVFPISFRPNLFSESVALPLDVTASSASIALSSDASASFCAVSQSTDPVCRVNSSVSTSSSFILIDPTGLARTLASEGVEKPQEVDESFRRWREIFISLERHDWGAISLAASFVPFEFQGW
jgi:hypothetical protein